jgi:hypothetical protein
MARAAAVSGHQKEKNVRTFSFLQHLGEGNELGHNHCPH